MVMAVPVNQKTVSYSTSYDGISDSVSEITLYDINDNNTVITSPSGAVTRQDFGSTNYENELSGLVYKETGPDGSLVEKIWKQNIADPTQLTHLETRLNHYVETVFLNSC